ncbi:hypothetical protein KC614_00775 [candidate division WWE3 bacterium]|uniref:Bacterial Ig domain-containing protein n=1 Tax=candidate division WWE3 bacterium TaxID=2053526 RepID=A0A955RRN0_UNCKA|nr:hypothetical protein [candidate division WWE3 bacterium]
MKKLLLIAGVVFGFTLLMFTGIMVYFSKYAGVGNTGEAVDGDVLADRQVLLVTPIPRSQDDLEIFAPYHREVVDTVSTSIRGRVEGSSVALITFNDGDDLLVNTDDEGIFETYFQLEDGVNQIALLALDDKDRVFTKEEVVGMYPQLSGQKIHFGLLGEVRNYSPETRVIKLTTPDDLLEIVTNDQTLFYNVNVDGSIQRTSFESIDNTKLIGVIGTDGAGGSYLAKEVRIKNYAYNFYGQIVEYDGNEMVVRRLNKAESTVIIKTDSAFREWTVDDKLAKLSQGNLRIGDYVYINAYILPKESRSRFYLNRLLLLSEIN